MRKHLLPLILSLSACVNIPPEKMATTSSKTLCDSYMHHESSEQNRVLIEKELASRGQRCIPNQAPMGYYPPPPVYRQQAPAVPPVRMPKTTNCYQYGNNTQCETY
jgi:hypothetical protein